MGKLALPLLLIAAWSAGAGDWPVTIAAGLALAVIGAHLVRIRGRVRS